MSRSSFSKAYEEITNLESMEMTFTIEDADLDKLHDVLKDINVNECPWFEVQDKHGFKAKYYREPHWIPCSERLPEESGMYLCTCADAGRLMVTLIKWQPKMESWNLTGARTYWKVLAWMPLPAPYQPKEDES